MLTKYEEKLISINQEVYDMGVCIINANKLILEALENSNFNTLDAGREGLKGIEKMGSDIDNKIITTLALFSPEARDLRELVSFLKVTNELTRAAANTKSFMKNLKTQSQYAINLDLITEYAVPLQKAAIKALEYAVEMVNVDDKEMIESLCSKANVEETKVDDLYAMVEKNILTLIISNKELSKEYFEVLGSIRKLEKIADRAATVANLLHFAQIGGELTIR